MITPFAIAEKIGIPVEQWPGKCHEIALLMLKHKIVRGKDRYGHYHGFIHPLSIFRGRPFTHHGWIERKTTIVDPTRWVFECKLPYIYTGPKDDPDYDFGGNRLRKMFDRPVPEFDPTANKWPIKNAIKRAVCDLLGKEQDEASIRQVMWLANTPLDELGDNAKAIFKWIVKDVKIPGFIPMDNRIEVLGK